MIESRAERIIRKRKMKKENKKKKGNGLCRFKLRPSHNNAGLSQMAMEVGGEARSFLPLDIIDDILSRLPLKSLLRFRCVCRRWNMLTYDIRFAYMHLDKSPARVSYVLNGIHYNTIEYYDLTEDGTEIVFRSFKIGVRKCSAYSMSNSVNGLTCAYNYVSGYLYLVNFFTREVAELPSTVEDCGWRFGFGCDVSTGEYKLIRIFCLDDMMIDYGCEILTIGTDQEWRYIGKTPRRIGMGEPVYLHSALHWKDDSSFTTNTDTIIIYKFSIKEENFGTVTSFKTTTLTLHSLQAYLCDLGGHLSVVLTDVLGATQIWMMKDYPASEWTNLYNIDVTSIWYSSYLPTVEDLAGEKIVFLTRDQVRRYEMFVSYDTHDKTFHKLGYKKNPQLLMVVRSASLLSPGELLGGVNVLQDVE